MSETTIDISPNGPYIVKNLIKLTNQKKELETKEVTALCRCGSSNNKPFCDGTHAKINFDDKKERIETYETNEYEGKDLTIADNPGICSHAGFCDGGSPKVFFSWENKKRICNPNNEEKEKIIETIRKCPSGSLAYKLDGKLFDEFFSNPEIFISQNGPLHIRGNINLNDKSSSELISKEHFTLCRCGSSKNKPFCDGAHRKVGFVDENN